MVRNDVTYNEKLMMLTDGKIKISNEVFKIKSEDQPDSSHVSLEHLGVTQDNEEDVLDREDI